jgi:Protein of unknown function (DUF4054)
MSITWADVTVIAPALSSASAQLQTKILAIVGRQVDVDVWGEFSDDGQLYLAAHLGTITSSGGVQAEWLTSESVGPLSRSYAMPPGIMGKLSTTRFGVEYERLLKIAAAPGVVVP